jgi:hypothetical protein
MDLPVTGATQAHEVAAISRNSAQAIYAPLPHIPVYMMPFFYVRAGLFCISRQMIEIKQKYEGKDNE